MTEREVFLAAVEIHDPVERQRYLEERLRDDEPARLRVAELLQAAQKVGRFLEVPAIGPTAAYQPPPTELTGTVIGGKYKLREKLGEGGMGSVWVADQSTPVQRRVAIKLIKSGADSRSVLARFEQERQALALMDHPNIAKVFDAGADQQPYIAMELIKGVPITKYCDDARLTTLQRLELFVPVCQAVQHAHQKGVIHRDLKPSNVLVGLYDGNPVPKVIDFGVAKATASRLTDESIYTEVGSLVGTLEYMSPEQAELDNLDIDTRADVYALGVMLYELLTGAVPFSRKDLAKAGFGEMLRVIREVEPQKPSTRLSGSGTLPSIAANRQTEPAKLTKLVKGDLDWIVMKALEKNRNRRYETANGFASDVQRYLAGEAVSAHPPSTAYRLKKFVQRNRGRVIAACLLLAALLAGMAGTSWGLLEAKRQRDEAFRQEGIAREETKEKESARQAESEQRKEAERATQRAVQALGMFTDEFMVKQIGSKKELTENETSILRNALKQWEVFAASGGSSIDARAIQAAGRLQVAKVQQNLGMTVEAETNFRSALDLSKALAADDPSTKNRQRLSTATLSMGLIQADHGNEVEAARLFLESISINEQLMREFPDLMEVQSELVRGSNLLGSTYLILNKMAEAEACHRKALALAKSLVAKEPRRVEYSACEAESEGNLGSVLVRIGKRPEAEEHLRAALKIRLRLVKNFPGTLVYRYLLGANYYDLGVLLTDFGKLVDAEAQFQSSLVVRQKLVDEYFSRPEYRLELSKSHDSLGIVLMNQGKRDAAESHFRLSLETLVKLAADFPKIPEFRQQRGNGHAHLAHLLIELGKLNEAEVQMSEALGVLQKLAEEFPDMPAYQRDLAASHENLGRIHFTRRKHSESFEQHRQCQAILKRLAEQHPASPEYRVGLANSLHNLGLSMVNLNRCKEGEEQLRLSMAVWERLVAEMESAPMYVSGLAHCRETIGVAIREGGRPVDSLPWFTKAIDALAPLHEKGLQDVVIKGRLRNCYLNRARTLHALKRNDEAIKDYDKVVELGSREEQIGDRGLRANVKIRAGKTAEGIAEIEDLLKGDAKNAILLYNSACGFALAAGAESPKKKEYADKAMSLLHAIVKAGHEYTRLFATDSDLNALRGREDFKKLLTELSSTQPVKPVEKK